jgi:hypothetical protein
MIISIESNDSIELYLKNFSIANACIPCLGFKVPCLRFKVDAMKILQGEGWHHDEVHEGGLCVWSSKKVMF